MQCILRNMCVLFMATELHLAANLSRLMSRVANCACCAVQRWSCHSYKRDIRQMAYSRPNKSVSSRPAPKSLNVHFDQILFLASRWLDMRAPFSGFVLHSTACFALFWFLWLSLCLFAAVLVLICVAFTEHVYFHKQNEEVDGDSPNTRSDA